MSEIRPVCLYQQYYCCPSHKDCRLYHLCSQLPKKPFVANSKIYRFIRAVPLDKAEIRKHQELYKFYNYLWGDLKNKTSDYVRKNHEHRMEYQRQYRARKNLNKDRSFDSVLFEGLCDKNCYDCKYDDCILPTWDNKQEYDVLYHKKNRNAKIKRAREYYQSHKEEVIERQKKYYQEHRQELIIKNREYRQKNKDKINARRREKYYQQKFEKEKLLNKPNK